MIPTLALDIAATTGWAHSDGRSGSWRLSPGRHPGRPLVALVGRIVAEQDRSPFRRIAFEDSQFHGQNRGAWTLARASEYRGAVLYVAAKLNLEILTINPASLKKWATGFGRADKAQMRAALRRLYNIDAAQPDECDALWVLRWAEYLDDHPQLAAAQARPAAPRSKPRRRPRRLLF